MASPIPCSLCGGISLYLAGKNGFCGNHRAEAYVAAAKENKNSQAVRSVERYRLEARMPHADPHQGLVRDGKTKRVR